jgi:hypothetical protein
MADERADLIERTYADEVWILSDPNPEHVPDDPPFGALQFTSYKVESVLQGLDLNKGSGSDGVPPIILKNRRSAMAKPRVFFPTGGRFHTLLRGNIICNSQVLNCWFIEECTCTCTTT